MVLAQLLPAEEWTAFGQRVVLHGRYVCKARKPLCDECTLMPHCDYFASQIERTLAAWLWQALEDGGYFRGCLRGEHVAVGGVGMHQGRDLGEDWDVTAVVLFRGQ